MTSAFSRILVPIDFGVESKAALIAAASLARALDASIHMLHVAADPTLTMGTPELYGLDVVRLRADVAADAQARLGELAATAADVRLTWEVQFGRPADRIAETATRMGAGLIVMGTHGRTAIGHLLIGSVADRVIRLARCPVMTVREFGAVRVAAPEPAAADREPEPQTS